MGGTVGDMPDQRQRLSKQFEDRLGHLLVGSLVAGAKVVYLSRLALLEHERNALAVVLHIDPIALLKPIADRKSTRLNSSHSQISYAVFCLKKKKKGVYFVALVLN